MEARFLLWLYLLSAGISLHFWFRRRDAFPVRYPVSLLLTAGAATAGLFWPPAERVKYDDYADFFFESPEADVDPAGLREGGAP